MKILTTLVPMLTVVASAQMFNLRAKPTVNFRLLQDPKVQQELKIVGPQIQKVNQCIQGLQSGSNFSATPSGGSYEDMQKKIEAMVKKNDDRAWAEVKKVLTVPQLVRFKQINYQVLGPTAFTVLEIANALKLTASQKSVVSAEEQSYSNAEMSEAMKGQKPKNGVLRVSLSPEAQSRLASLKSKAVAKIASTFDASQKATWAQLTGPVFRK